MRAMKISVHDGIVHLELSGPFKPGQFERVVEQIIVHPDFKPGMPLLIDDQGTDFDVLSENILDRVNKLVSPMRDHFGGIVAISLPRDVQFGTARAYHAYFESLGVVFMPFRNPGDALRWLRAQAG
jgi:hypothetical protein